MLDVFRISKSYGGGMNTVSAVRDLTFRVKEGEVVTLVGPSGCGKTTVLRCVAGLERPDTGEVAIDGSVVHAAGRSRVPTHQRPIGVVFQSLALWAHLSVFENVAYPLRVGSQRLGKAELHGRVERVLEMLQIGDLARRATTQLSGGQQQRVAVARALIREPRLLLMDEPLSSLDALLRDQMRLELRELFSRSGVAVLYITHDLTEALFLSDRVLVMNLGALVREGTPYELALYPGHPFVEGFLRANQLLQQRLGGLAAGFG